MELQDYKPSKLTAVLWDRRHGNKYDISKAIYDITIDTSIKVAPAKCEFTVIKCNDIEFWEGAVIQLSMTDPSSENTEISDIFTGTIFSKSRTHNVELIHCVAYDNIRFLNYRKSLLFENNTILDIFNKVCETANIPHAQELGVSCEGKWTKPYQDGSFITMLQEGIDNELVQSEGKNQFFIGSSKGVITLYNSRKKKCPYVIGDRSLVNDFKYTTTIENGIYNVISLFRPDATSGASGKVTSRDEFRQINTEKITEWGGKIQFTSQVDPNLEDGQVRDRLTRIANALSNRGDVRRRITLDCLSYPFLRAGWIVQLNFSDLGDTTQQNLKYIVKRCTQKFTNQQYFMSLKLDLLYGDEKVKK